MYVYMLCIYIYMCIVDLRGFDSSIIFKLTGGIPRAIGNLPENLSQAMLVGIMLVVGVLDGMIEYDVIECSVM